VADGERFHFQLAYLEFDARLYELELGLDERSLLLELDIDQALCELGGIDGQVDLGQYVGQSADMVFMPVGDDDAAQLGFMFKQVADIGYEKVDAEHLILGEHHAGIDNDDVVAVLDGHHVLADLTESAEGYYLKLVTGHFLLEKFELGGMVFFRFKSAYFSQYRRELEYVGLYYFAQAALVKRRCRVIHGEVHCIADAPGPAVHLADALVGEVPGHGKTAQRNHDLWFENFHLAFQPFAAGLDFTGHGIAVFGRAAFNHVGYENLVSFQVDHAKELFEELSGRAYKRPARLVFIPAGSFANEKEGCIFRPFARHNLGAVAGQITILAAFYFSV
jgi:hypothetical protein